ncbi:hypothetical protein [Anthocerotibacter panamensis]|uniref:hypothetical protein n=1 Tax=Anthocerotibacter panamensis TaxID=2857077 RepID=UPI001C402758|nr:hypothetical protein [Anthocerotibacter panamensis]
MTRLPSLASKRPQVRQKRNPEGFEAQGGLHHGGTRSDYAGRYQFFGHTKLGKLRLSV